MHRFSIEGQTSEIQQSMTVKMTIKDVANDDFVCNDDDNERNDSQPDRPHLVAMMMMIMGMMVMMVLFMMVNLAVPAWSPTWRSCSAAVPA